MKNAGILFIISLWYIQVYANIYTPHFKNITIENGLSNSTVRCITKDADGFIWFGTYDGLCKYDGLNIKIFRKIENNNESLNHNHISSLFSDSKHQLFVGTRKGLNQYIPKYETFKPIEFKEFDTDSIRNSSLEITCIVEDDKQNMYVSTLGEGLLVRKSSENDFHQVKLIGNEHNLFIHAITFFSPNIMYLGIDGLGLVKYETDSGTVTLINNSISQFQCMFYLNGMLFIGNNNGLFTYNENTNTISEFLNIPELKSTIQFVKEDVNKVLWIGTENKGIILYDTKNKAIQHIPAGYNDSHLSSEGVYCMYIDNSRLVWIGTMRGGVEEWNPNQKPFFSRKNLKSKTPASNFITSFVEIEPGIFWLGSDGGGIQQYNFKNDDFEENTILYKLNKLADNAVIALAKDKYNNVWIATYGKGLIKFNLITKKIERYSKDNSTLNSDYIWSLYFDKQDNLWIGCVSDAGLYRFNFEENKINPIYLGRDNILTIAESANNQLILGSFNGVIVYEPKIQKSITYSTEVPVRSVCEDKTGNIWIGTEGNGIMNLNLQTGELKNAAQKLDFLKKSTVMAILEDEQKNLWFSTTNGLYRYNYKTGILTNYDKKDGLQSEQFNYSAALKTKENMLFFGGINGFTFFDPLKITVEAEKYPLHIVDFNIHNKSVFSDIKTNAKIIEMLSDKNITIKHNDAYIRIDFTAISFDNPEKIQYACMLEGLDKNWNNTGSNRSINYSGLNPGDYIFKVKYEKQPEQWNDNPLELRIKVLPPFYQTWWAYMVYALIIAGILVMAMRIQRRENKLKHDLLLADLKEEHGRQVQHMREQFFINISHELRTPLTLIIPPLKDSLFSEPYSPLSQNELKSIYNNSNRLLLLINKLLLFRKNEMGKSQLQVIQTDIVDFAFKIYENFKQIARKRNIIYIFKAPDKPVLFWFDKDKMEIIMYNLLSNAFKYTSEYGKIEIEIYQTNGNILTIHVRDNGSGIAAKDLEHIFNRFYTSDKFSGIGIGLSLVKNYVELLHGQLHIKSELNEGSDFYMDFELNIEYAPNEISDGNADIILPSKDMVELVEIDTQLFLNQHKDENTEQKDSNQLKVIIVEDNQEILNYIKKIVLEAGMFDIYEATNGKAALKMATKIFPDMIISDIHMPEMNGLELCRVIKENIETNHIYFILITADIFESTENKGLKWGADEFITKPFDKTKLLNKISTISNYQQKIRKYFENKVIIGKQITEPTSVNTDFIDKCISLVRNNYNSDNFNLQAMAQQTNMSQSALYKKIKLCTGKSINEFIRTVKLSIASELIMEGKLTITEIASEIGMYDPKYFRECFKKQFGVSPSNYRKHKISNT